MKTAVITNRKIRVYKSDNTGKLIPIGGLRKGRAVCVDDTERKFGNTTRTALRVLCMEEPNIYIIKSDKNFKPAPAGFKYNSANGADGSVSDCNVSGFEKRKYIAADALDYETEMEFHKAEGDWDFNYNHDDGTFSYGSYEFNGKPDQYNLHLGIPDDSLVDEIYLSANAEEGELTIAQISKLSKAGQRRYKKALRISKKSSISQEKQGDAELNKALAKKIKKSADEKDDPLNLGSTGAAASGGGIPTMYIAIGFTVFVVLTLGLVMFSGGKKKTAAAPAAAPAAGVKV